MDEQPKFLRPELIPSSSERAETPPRKAEGAITSTKEFLDRSDIALSRAKKDIAKLPEGMPRRRLEKHQELLAGRLTGFKKKVAAVLAGLALAVGGTRAVRDNLEKPSKFADIDGASAEEMSEGLAHEPVEDDEDEYLDEDGVIAEQAAPLPSIPEVPPDPNDPFDPRNNFSEGLPSEEEKAAEKDEQLALRSYADLVVDEWVSDEGVDEFLKILKSSDVYAGSREKADEIGADLEEFDKVLRHAVAEKIQAINKKAEESPDTLSPVEGEIYYELNHERLELEAELLRTLKTDGQDESEDGAQQQDSQEHG